MFPGFGYLAGRLKEAQDPAQMRCKRYDEVAECHREIGIISGYRHENCSILQAILSLFRANNETVNFWTHFIPTLYFLWLFISLGWSMPLFTDAYLFPFVFYMATTCAYPLVSCLAHAFSCLSITATHIFFYLDYAMLSVYSWGVAVLYYSYSLPPSMIPSTLAKVFLPVASFNAVVSTWMSCHSRHVFRTNSFKGLKLVAFTFPYLWDSAPLLWRIFNCQPDDDSCSLSSFHHKCQFVGVLLASFFYGSHIPERLAPGRFDFVGHSHNLLHLFGITATYQQMRGALIDLQDRRETLENLHWTTDPTWVTVATPIIVLLNVAIVTMFSLDLCKKFNAKENVIAEKKQH